MRTAGDARPQPGRAVAFSIAALAVPLLAFSLLAAVALAVTAPAAPARGADPGEVTWTRYWDSVNEDRFDFVATCTGGDVVAAGHSGSGAGQHIVVARYAPSGARRWVRVVAASAAVRDSVMAMTTDADGNSVLAGLREVGGAPPDALVVKVSARGRVAWTRVIDGGVSGSDVAAGVATDAGGGVYVACSMEGTAGDTGLVLRLRARSGATLWPREFTGEHTLLQPYGIAVDGRGFSYITGAGRAGALSEMVTVGLTPAGRVRWTAEEPGDGGDQSAGLHVALARGGAIYVAGAAGPAPDDSDLVMARYSTAGVRQWRDELDVSEGAVWREVPAALAVDHLGNAFIAGYGSPGHVSPSHGFVARWRPGGGRWYWDGPVSSETDTALLCVAADEVGGCYAAGRIIANYHDPGNEIEVGYFARFRGSGARAWERAHAYVGGRTSFSGMTAWPGRGICLVGSTQSPEGIESRALIQLRRR
jgi:hypothetical protein